MTFMVNKPNNIVSVDGIESDSIENYIQNLYIRILNRTPQNEEVAKYVKLINKGTVTKDDLILIFLNSEENNNRIVFVNDFYPKEVHWEYFCNSDVDMFVDQAYYYLLRRKADKEGRMMYISKLLEGSIGMAGVLWNISNSEEAKNNPVKILGLEKAYIKENKKIKKIKAFYRIPIIGNAIYRRHSRKTEEQIFKKRISDIDECLNRLLAEESNDKKQTDYLQNQIDELRPIVSQIHNSIQIMAPQLNAVTMQIGGYAPNMDTLYSFALNESLFHQNHFHTSELYQYYKSLHENLKVYDLADKSKSKIRIGKGNDGGYIMMKPYSREKIAYSFGICDDVSWDKEMAEDGYQVFQYDHTIERLPEEHPSFHWKKIGLTGHNETDNMKTLETLIRDNGHDGQQGMLLKMDIEGWEWDFIANCDQKVIAQFDQIVMEMHDLTDASKFDLILKATQKLSETHSVIHVHGNNNGRTVFCGEYITPDVLEITLIRKDLFSVEKSEVSFPTLLDFPNRPNTQDIWLGIW